MNLGYFLKLKYSNSLVLSKSLPCVVEITATGEITQHLADQMPLPFLNEYSAIASTAIATELSTPDFKNMFLKCNITKKITITNSDTDVLLCFPDSVTYLNIKHI